MGKILLRDLSTAESAERTKATRFDIYEGFGSPEGVVTAKMGDVYINRNGGTSSTFWMKETGFNTNTGWVAAGTGGSAGWIDEQVFTATEGQTEFIINEFNFDANTKLTVYHNGIDIDETLDWVRDVGNSKITLNNGVTESARVKVKQWS